MSQYKGVSCYLFSTELRCSMLFDSFSIPQKLQQHIHKKSYISPLELKRSLSKSQKYYWTEICFIYCPPQKRFRFMGVSLNQSRKGKVTELVSSILRSSPSEEIEVPWNSIFSFCETALNSHLGRVVPPFVCLSSMSEPQNRQYHKMRSFNYDSMQWTFVVDSLSLPSAE